MSVKQFRGRVQLACDTLSNFESTNPVLLLGELAIAVVPSETTGEKSTIFVKAGNGTDAFKNLPFLTAYAGDVYAWAKEPTKPEYDASEIKNLASYISSAGGDTNTTYQIVAGSNAHEFKFQSKEKDATSWTDEYTLTIPDEITYTVGSTNPGELTLTPSTGTAQTITIVDVTSSKADITKTSTKVPTAGAIAEYIEEQINAQVSRAFLPKGNVATVADLPATATASPGDVYHVVEDGGEYYLAEATDGTRSWEPLGSNIDLSNYYTKTEVDSKIPGTVTTTADGLMLSTDKAKLDALDENAEENVIDTVTKGGQAYTIADKTLPLADIAFTGNVMDLIQDADNTLVINSGNAQAITNDTNQLVLSGGTASTVSNS